MRVLRVGGAPADAENRVVHLCGKISRQTNRQTNKRLRVDCVDKPQGPALKVPSLARSVPKPLSIFAVDQWLTSVTD